MNSLRQPYNKGSGAVMRAFVGAILILVLGGVGCSSASRRSGYGFRPLPLSSGSNAPTGSAEVFGSVDGVTVRRADLSADIERRLRDIVGEFEQRRWQLLWVGVEDVISERLLRAEAGRRGVTVEALLTNEVDAKIGEPSEEEVRALYAANQDLMGSNYDQAAPHLRQQLLESARTERRRALVDSLRQRSDVRYAFRVPELPRVALEPVNAPAKGGPRDAKVVLVAFSDFQCPYSAQTRRILGQLLEMYPRVLRVEHQDLPLPQHPQAQRAAQAARCAHEQGKFWPYYDVLFEHPKELELADLKRYAREVELKPNLFDACMASSRPKAAVDESVELARSLGVQGTPALFLNGMKLVGLLPVPLLQMLIEHELDRS